MNVLLVPTLALDLSILDRLAASVDYPIQHKVIINNGRPYALDQWQKDHPDWKVLVQGENRGVSKSWNMATEIFPGERGWMISNDDSWFDPGAIEAISKTFDKSPDETHMVWSNEGWHCFIWTQKAMDRFGLFDENLWPAYHEDEDMSIRFGLGGCVGIHVPSVEGRNVHHGKPKTGGVNYCSLISGCSLFTRDYMRRKWGGWPPTFNTPFNMLGAPLSHWVMDWPRRRKIQPIWDCFINHPKVSLYDNNPGFYE
jgi:GT2 family glycosyltransferase